jgi:zinc/manganese transport system ATP-binding protein
MHIACKNLTISFDRHPVIHHLNCEFKMSNSTAIIGTNGAGKSTLLKAIIGQIKPESGEVSLANIQYSDIAYLPQINQLDLSIPLTVEDLILLGSWYDIGLFKKPNNDTIAKINDALIEVGLDNFNKKYLNELSSGQLQRVLFAKIILQNSKIIILDEPFNAIDTETTTDLLNLLKKWQQQENKTIIAVLHDMTQVKKHFNYTLFLSKQFSLYAATEAILENLEINSQQYNNINNSQNIICNIE